MIQYFVEFVILHSLFLFVFKLLLSQETQLKFLRSFLLGTTLLSLIIPLIELPSFTTLPTINLEATLLSASVVTSSMVEETSLSLYEWLFLIISSIFLIRFIYGLIRIFRWYKKSELDTTFDLPIRRVEGINNSFTFFKWIFIDPSHFENPGEIIKHEGGHSQQMHSIDILFFNLLTIPFWFVPSLWIMIHELKKIHEYEADQFALRSTDQNNYIKTLVHSTLKAHGLNLASSFDDAAVVKRLNFIKKMKRKVSPWKVGSIMAIVLISGAMFACQEELDAEIQQIVEESNQQILLTKEIETALYEATLNNPGKEFVVVEVPIALKEKIVKLEKYDPDQIEAVFVQKNSKALHETLEGENSEGHTVRESEEHEGGSIVMIVAKDSDIYRKTMYHEQSKQSNDVHTLVEKAAIFPGGKEAWFNYLVANMKYPRQARKIGVEGNVLIEAVVEKDGSITNATISKGIGAGCDKEALRVVNESPKWIAATTNGEPVRMKVVLPIQFRLN